MSKTTNYILELERLGEVYFKEDEKSYVTRDRRRHTNADEIYGSGETSRDSLGEAGNRPVSIYSLRGQGTPNKKTIRTETSVLPTGAELSEVLQGGASNQGR